ncbi:MULTISPECIES: hypothetical protein [Ralstonia]|uniref:hypothetical protein n=1 Tax=Ralstonia TaxID=48736 RepID=UPI000C7A6696|nr:MULTISPECIES: hypothetical protein [Ralstonia]PLT20496.1 hypothetical protein CXP34_03120 [Ralstonia mannitolilytica]
MFSIFKNTVPLLIIKVNGETLCAVVESDIPCEKTPAMQIGPNGIIEFIDEKGVTHKHELGEARGWYHFSIRVHQNRACQVDCVITDSKDFDSDALTQGRASGIRFQPFFISGAMTRNEELHGKGLFARGLHFNGTITPGNVVLSCECDRCKKSFQVRSYHAGFSNAGYFYSGSGKFTITVNDRIAGCPAALSEPNLSELAALEAALPLAPDGTKYRYANPFRCPHCTAPYIDFEANPGSRPGEYYGNYFVGAELLRYEPARE